MPSRWSAALIGPLSLRAPLLTLLTGVGAAFLTTWLTRIASGPAEPALQGPGDDLPADGDSTQRRHELMTTAEGSRLLLEQGHLVLPRLKDPETEPTV